MIRKGFNKQLAFNIAVFIILAGAVTGIWWAKNRNAKNEVPITETNASMSVEGGLDLSELTSYGVPVIIKFGATWCGPCQAFAPILEEVHAEMQGKVIIKDVDIDQHGDITRQFPVSVVPTMVLIDSEGKPYTPEEPNRLLKYFTHKDTGEHVYTTMEGVLNKEQLIALLADMDISQ